MPRARTLVHSAWFDFALTRLGGAEEVDDVLGRELYRLSLYADLVPTIAEHASLRIYRTAHFYARMQSGTGAEDTGAEDVRP